MDNMTGAVRAVEQRVVDVRARLDWLLYTDRALPCPKPVAPYPAA